MKRELDKEIVKKWWNALDAYRYFGDTTEMDNFKLFYPSAWKLLNAYARKKVKIKKMVQCMSELNEPVYWFTLTFNNEKINNTEVWNRKRAQTFLNDIAPLWVMVEEYGEENERYHIHGFCIFKYGKNHKDFMKWDSRQSIEIMRNIDMTNKKIKYLCNYVTKELPVIRRSKQLTALCRDYDSFSKMKGGPFNDLYEKNLNKLKLEKLNLF